MGVYTYLRSSRMSKPPAWSQKDWHEAYLEMYIYLYKKDGDGDFFNPRGY